MSLRTFMKRLPASLLLALSLIYLAHAVFHAAQGMLPVCRGSSPAIASQDPWLTLENLSGEKLVGCHFFCNGLCPVPPLAEPPSIPEILVQGDFERPASLRPVSLHPQPEKAPPRFLA
ncbi:MAG: hypothetical protein HY823_14225 [Acidobacteria bacterium]|nr:hypothetical protein [Acidobacteriota bacterium]